VLRILTLLLVLTCAASAQVPVTGAGLPKPLGLTPQTAYSASLPTNDTGDGGTKFAIITPTISAAGTQIRATFKASSEGTWVVAKVGICVVSTTSSCVATMTELKFSGGSGFSIPASTTITSDFASLATSVGQQVIVCMDITTFSPMINSASTGTTLYVGDTNGCSASSATGTPHSNFAFGVSLIEVE
jgi:hypothetical protein